MGGRGGDGVGVGVGVGVLTGAGVGDTPLLSGSPPSEGGETAESVGGERTSPEPSLAS